MKCPHCTVAFHDNERFIHVDQDPDGDWGFAWCRCAACKRLIFRLVSGTWHAGNIQRYAPEKTSRIVHPKASSRAPLSPEIPKEYAEDYNEAGLVFADSPKASAALSRRCLQHLLRDEAKATPKNLFAEIQEVLDSRKLPSHIADSLHGVREIGNFAAHPIKSTSTGEIEPVEPGEAEWNLDVLESLFDFYFVAPAATKAMKEALNKKLAEAGKQPLK
jgi:hypothetical protein